MAREATPLACPSCNHSGPCSSEDIGRHDGYEMGQWDLNWYERRRQCLNCMFEFKTAELPITFAKELGERRTQVKVLEARIRELEAEIEGFKDRARTAIRVLKGNATRGT